MKFWGKLLVIGIVISTLFSCSKEEEGYSLGDIWLSLGMIETEETSGYNFIIYCDNGDTLLPAANDVANFETYNNQRVLANYTVLDEVGTSTNKFYVKINSLKEVLFKDVIEVTEENADSLGNDLVSISKMWVVDDMLNVEFQYLGAYYVHYINMGYTTNEEGKIAQPIELQFLHNNNGEDEGLLVNGIVTFKLNKLKIEGQNSVEFTVATKNLYDVEQTFTGTYNY